jgi:hypothetical protein
VSVGVGAVLALAGLGSLVGIRRIDVDSARALEERRGEARQMLKGGVPASPAAASADVGT